MEKQRIHREWFRTVSLGNRKSCPNCKAKLGQDESIWTWGEYVYGRWHNVMHFCKECYDEDVRTKLEDHMGDCGCTFELLGYRGEILPAWLTLPTMCSA